MAPAELLALRDVNKALRRMLDSGKKAAAIWVKSREYHGIPAPFEGFTERTWAQFIFGGICQVCCSLCFASADERDGALLTRIWLGMRGK
jgi:hypothetical protein